MLITVVNYYVDPAHEFFSSGQFETMIAKLQLDHKNIINLKDYNERILQKLMISKMPAKPEVLVLGSSRSMAIDQSVFKGLSFYNASVSGATLEDDLAIFYLYQKRGWVPKVLIISVDPWLLNKNNNQTRWNDLSKEFTEAQAILNVENQEHEYILSRAKWVIQKYSQLINRDYFVSSLKKIYLTAEGHGNVFDLSIGDSRNTKEPIKLYDGTLLNSKQDELTDAANANQAGLVFAQQNPIYSLGEYKSLDADKMKLFENFIHYLVQRQVKVILFYAPYQQNAYQEINHNPKYVEVNAAASYFHSIAEKNHLQEIGSYDPEKVKFHPDDFIDGMHSKAKSIHKLFASCYTA